MPQPIKSPTNQNQSIFFSNRLNIKDYICPFKIDLRELNHIKFLSNIPKFARSFFIITLPRFLTFGETLRNLYKFGNNNTSIYIYPIPEGIAQSNLSAIINNLEAERLQAIKDGNQHKLQVITYKKTEAEVLRDEIATNFNKLFEVSIFSTIFANSLEELDSLSELLGIEMSKTMINIRSAWALQESTLISNTPCCNSKITKNNTFDTFGLATVFPFTSTDISHSTGIPFGINKKSGIPIFIDAFNPSLPNYNFIILGKVASGKRVAVQLLSLRSFVIGGIQNVALDADGRYCKIAKTLDGINVSFNPTSKIIINPFEIEPEIVKDEITGKERIILDLENKIKDVTNILMTMARGPIISQYPNHITKKIIEEIVAEEYQAAGITNNPESLYSSQGADLIGTKIVRHKKPFPTIGSWYKRLCKKAEANTNTEYKYHYEYLIKYMKDFVNELGGRISYFDGQSNYELPQDTPFLNFDLSKLDQKFQKPLVYQVLLSWLWEKYFKPNSQDKLKADKKRVIIDEAWLLLPYPEATDFLNIMGERATKRNVSLLISSQKFNDFYQNGKLNTLLSSASIKLLMKHDEDELAHLKETFKLTNGERDFLSNCLKGEGILQIGTSSAQIYIAPLSSEIELIEANPTNFMVIGNT